MIRGLIACSFGILCAMVGLDPMSATPRLTFGFIELFDGLSLLSIAIGMLGLAEIIFVLEKKFRDKYGLKKVEIAQFGEKRGPNLNLVIFFQYWKTILRSSFIGSCVGALPGIGASMAAFLGYGSAKKYSKQPELFGKGNLDGIAGPEAANSAVVGGSFVPLLTLGIPGM